MSTAIAKNFQIGADGTATNNFTIFQPASPDGTLRIGNGNTGITTGLVTLTSAGNLGLGVTPSAWSTSYKALQLNGNASLSAFTTGIGQMNLSHNAYRASGAWTYLGNDAATLYSQTSGIHYWYTAPSGTAGNAISFTQAMTLDASGNLLVGTTSGLGVSRATVVNDQSARSVISIRNTSASGYSAIELYDNGGSQQGAMGWGNASVGVTGAQSATYFYSTGPITFLAGGTTERARIDSSGNLLVGTTTGGTGSIGFQIGANGYTRSVQSASTNGITTWDTYSTGAGAYRFYVGMGGTIYATSTTITAISDQRLKENIQDIDVGLDAVMALKPRKFDWKEGKGKNKKGDRGWIAQEFEQVFPDMIDEWRDPAPQGEEPYKAVNADLIPVLVKALQELNAKVEAQAAEIAALKGQA